MKRAHWLAVLAVVVSACGDDTSKAVNSNTFDLGEPVPDSSVPDMGSTPDVRDEPDEGTTGDTGGDAATPDMASDMGGDTGPDPALCGNAMIDPGEDCDDANTDDTDECKSDCTFSCGDGELGAAELCDTAIADGMPGACPASCPATACTTATLQRGGTCLAECVFGDITACVDADGCCPTACDETNDDDCAAVCGNGVVEAGEVCDGMCPTTCDDGVACTADSLMGSAATCDAVCANTAITACVDGDGCCAPGCTSLNDDDCSDSCGNAIVEPPELCDGNCPALADCNDNDVCTADSLSGSAQQCNAQCVNTPLGCVAGTMDGCCAAGCNANTDGDCAAICGNGVVEPGEQCDDGGTAAGDGCDATCQSEAVATAFRMSDLDLMDPHIYIQLFGCRDITNGNVPFNASPPINALIENAVTLDEDGDGLLDLSFLVIFRPLDQADGATGGLSIAEADCTEPMSSTTCVVDPAQHFVQSGSYTTDTGANCLEPFPSTTRPYTPAVDASVPPCFVSTNINLTIDIGGILIPLTDVQVGATYVGSPATGLTNGLLRGFIAEADADAIALPGDLPLIGGDPLSSVLPGGTGNCAAHDDRDIGPDGVTMGWWFYLNFPADAVPVTEL